MHVVMLSVTLRVLPPMLPMRFMQGVKLNIRVAPTFHVYHKGVKVSTFLCDVTSVIYHHGTSARGGRGGMGWGPEWDSLVQYMTHWSSICRVQSSC